MKHALARSSIGVVLLGVLSLAPVTEHHCHVQVGWCTPLKDIDAARAAGFEYLELGTSEIAALSDTDFEAAVERIRQVGLPTRVTNLVLPATLKVTGPRSIGTQQMLYVKKAFARLSRLGTKIVVFGSGGARACRTDFPEMTPSSSSSSSAVESRPEARSHDITIAVEPLRRQETNIINSASEGLELVEAVNDPNFQLMIDFYHLASEQEDPAIVLRASPYPPSARGQSAGPCLSPRVGRIRLRAVLRESSHHRLRQAHQRRGDDERFSG